MFTVFGASGFVGGALVEALRDRGEDVQAPARAEILPTDADLGHVIYAAGVTQDAGERPLDVTEAHVSLPSRLLGRGRFLSFLYLSSASVYLRAATGDEACELPVAPTDSSQMYSISKLAGEALCMAIPGDTVRVVRLASVYATDRESPGFLGQVLREATTTGRLRLRMAPDSAKDYVSLADVVELLPAIATRGRARLYNVAGGSNVSHREIVSQIGRHLSITVEVEEGAPLVAYPEISIQRVREEFTFEPRRFIPDLDVVIALYLARYGPKR